MKKISVFFLCLIVYAVNSFAAEVVFSPGIGFSVYTVRSHEVIIKGKNLELSDKPVTYTIPTPSIGLDMHFIHEKNGFTFSLINNAAFPISMYKRGGFGNGSMKTKGFIWDGQMLFGYTYGVKQPFSIHAGIGPGVALGQFWTHLNNQQLENFYHAWTPIALHLGVQYIFTKHFGITVGLHDMISFSGLLRSIEKPNIADGNNKVGGTVGFGNVFTLRIAATFRL
ncbi:DUF2715 domain-containing protein [Treponema pedis]|uniref:DUF2715 domain-containing protein n=1 Tax=Treponema pedis TaxID=409322 RepID=UPI00197FF644|nr:DUF2715 domain-containing protein [Treponema pedis]QSI04023.1 hypothetical protein DYQ05_03330 [Treponema pedis]